MLPVHTFQCSTPGRNTRRQPKSCFGENQLLPGSISFSLQPTSHPRVLHCSPVRPSRCLSTTFSLLMGSSPGFGSDANDYLFALFTLAFTVPPGDNPLGSRVHQLVGSFFNRHAVEGLVPLRLLVDVWFQVYFTPLTGVLFTFPSRYLFTIDLKEYVALPVSSGRFTQATRVLSYSRTLTEEVLRFRIRDYYPLGFIFPDDSPNETLCNSSCVNTASAPYNPHASREARCSIVLSFWF